MKKMMVMLAAVAVAICSQAAMVDWSASGLKSYSGQTFYLFDGAKSKAVLDLFGAVESTTGSQLDSLAILKGTITTKGKASAGSTDIGTATSVMAVVLTADGIADKANYLYIVDDVSSYVYTPPSSTPGTFTSTLASAGTVGTMKAKTDPDPGPEPTSGLLLLLGMAGLALRRKQK